MSIASFQRALTELTLSPAAATALRLGDFGRLDGYALTARERARLADIVHQPGISVHCSLSRGNRLEVILAAFPMTCVLLRAELRGLVDELWRLHRPSNYQLFGEEDAFAELVARKLAARALAVKYAADILAYETACLKLTRQARIDPKVAHEAAFEFCYEPSELLIPLSRGVAPLAGLLPGRHPVRVSLREGQFAVDSSPTAFAPQAALKTANEGQGAPRPARR